MLKKSVISIAILASSVMLASTYSPYAQAGYKHNYRHGGYYDYHHYRPYRRGYRHHRHRSNRGAYLVGGIALGALISHAYHAPRYRHHDGYVVREVRREPAVVRREGRITRSLFRDRDGNCYERRRDNGDELLIELPASECAW